MLSSDNLSSESFPGHGLLSTSSATISLELGIISQNARKLDHLLYSRHDYLKARHLSIRPFPIELKLDTRLSQSSASPSSTPEYLEARHLSVHPSLIGARRYLVCGRGIKASKITEFSYSVLVRLPYDMKGHSETNLARPSAVTCSTSAHLNPLLMDKGIDEDDVALPRKKVAEENYQFTVLSSQHWFPEILQCSVIPQRS
ncbi:hypothetical protein U1Q18_011445 [Sarracenia purpurea var. burkii]